MQSHYQQGISFNNNSNSFDNSMFSSQWQPFQQYQPFTPQTSAFSSPVSNSLPVPSSVTENRIIAVKETNASSQRVNERISPSLMHRPMQTDIRVKNINREKPSLLLNLLFDEPIPFVNPFSPTPIDSEDDPALTFFTKSTPSPSASTRSISSIDSTNSTSRYSNKRSNEMTSSSSKEMNIDQIKINNKRQKVNLNSYQSEKLTKETLLSIQQQQCNILNNENEEIQISSVYKTSVNRSYPVPYAPRALPAPAPAVVAPIKSATVKSTINNDEYNLDEEETKIEINVDTNDDESKAPITISGVLRNNTTLVLDMVTPKDSSRILPSKFHIVQSPLDGKHRILSNQFKLRTACDRCTKMKIRCIPLKPGQCEGCKKRKIDCIFSPQKKRGPVNICHNQTPANFPLQQQQ